MTTPRIDGIFSIRPKPVEPIKPPVKPAPVPEANFTAKQNEAAFQSSIRRAEVEAKLPVDPAAVAKQKQELALDLGQIALDVVGIFDPTPISDGANALISIGRGDILGAVTSGISILPYVGDAAKLGKLGKYAQTIAKAADLAKTDAAFAKLIRPALEQMSGILNKVPLDKLPSSARSSLEGIKKNIDEALGNTSFTGTLRGQPVTLQGVEVRSITYTKRSAADLDTLRKAFDGTNGARAQFVKSLPADPAKLEALKKAGLNDMDIKLLTDGKIPQGWQVHHKLPLDDGGTNDFSNLVLIKNEPYHKVITNTQNAGIRGMQPGQSRQLDFPIPPGFVYPPTP